MLNTLKQSSQNHNTMTLADYITLLGIKDQQFSHYFNTTIICSKDIIIQQFPLQKPQNFLCQKYTQLGQFDENKQEVYNQQKLITSQKFLLSDEMEQLYQLIGEQNMDFLLKHFKIFIKETTNSETYIQIHGEPIMKPQIKYKNNQFEKIQRQQILYCNHMSRNVGLFKKNFISLAKIQIINSKFCQPHQITQKLISIQAAMNITTKLKQDLSQEKYLIKENQIQVFYSKDELKYLENIFENLTLKLQKIKFHKLFKYYSPLPKNYLILKQRVKSWIKNENENVTQIYDDLYSSFTSQYSVIIVLRNFLEEIIPLELFGKQNFGKFLQNLNKFITSLRFEDQNYYDFLYNFKVTQIFWFTKNTKSKSSIQSNTIKLYPIFKFLFQNLIIPFIRHNFYVTERMKEDWKLFYYRKEIWHLIMSISLKQLTKINYKEIQFKTIKSSYIGKLRLVPKPGTFRPIVTYNRKSKNQKMSLNKQLLDVKNILRNLRNNNLGYSVFGNPQVFSRLEEFKQLWIKLNYPQIYFITMDVQKCYDSIQLTYLMQFLEESQLFSNLYLINKYYLILRNNRSLKAVENMRDLFNILERTCALPINNKMLLSKGYTEYIQKNKLAIIINNGLQNSMSIDDFKFQIKEICTNNIVQFKNKYFLQTLGIPQGLNISGILCSFYMANVEQKLNYKISKETLIMRLTDDYCCLSFEKQNLIQICENFQAISKKYKLNLNDDKTKHNLTDEQQKEFKWIGKIIELKKLNIKPAFYKDPDDKFQYQINVNLPEKIRISFFKIKLKSLILNQFKFYYNIRINDKPTMIKIIKIFVHQGLVKLVSFIKKSYIFQLQKNNRRTISNFTNMIKSIQDDIVEYCLLQCQDGEFTIKKLKKIISKQFKKTIKKNKILNQIINYKKL